MAREEQPREDLLREATALVERAEWVLPATGQRVVAGFRRDGSISFYFDEEPVYQFNAQGQLRRAFHAGQMLKAERGELVALEKVRGDDCVALVRNPLSEAQQSEFLAQLDQHLHDFAQRLNTRHAELVGQVPPTVDVVGRVQQWLDERPPTTIAASPRVG